MKQHYEFGKMKGEPNPYVKQLKQPITIRLDTATVAYLSLTSKAVTNGISARGISQDEEGSVVWPPHAAQVRPAPGQARMGERRTERQRARDHSVGGHHRVHVSRLRAHDRPRRSGAGDPRMGPRWEHSRERLRRARPTAAATPSAAARGSAKREDKDSLTVGSRTAVRRLGCRREDKDSPGFLIFPHSTTPPRRLRGCHGCGAPSPPSRRSSIRRPNAQPEGRGWSRRGDRHMPARPRPAAPAPCVGPPQLGLSARRRRRRGWDAGATRRSAPSSRSLALKWAAAAPCRPSFRE